MEHRVGFPVDPQQHADRVQVVEALPGALVAEGKLAPWGGTSRAATVPGRDLVRLWSDRGDAVGGIVAAARFGAQPERLGDAPDLRRRAGHVEGRPGAPTRVDDRRHAEGALRPDRVQKRVDDGIRPALHVPHAAERAVHVDDGASAHLHLPQRSDDVLERDQRPVRNPAFHHLPVRRRACCLLLR